MRKPDEWYYPSQIYDAHLHFFTYEGMKRRAKANGYESVEGMAKAWGRRIGHDYELPPPTHEAFLQKWVKEMDSKEVDKALMFPDWNDYSFVELATREYPDRFIPFVMINPTVEGALDFLHVCFHTNCFIAGYKRTKGCLILRSPFSEQHQSTNWSPYQQGEPVLWCCWGGWWSGLW